MGIKIFAAASQDHTRVRLRKLERDILKPLRSFKPPMPKQFRVEGRSKDGGGAVAAKSFQHVASDVGKMLGVAAGTSQRAIGMVGSLVAQINLGTGYLPIAMSAGPAFFVEVEIRSLAGI